MTQVFRRHRAERARRVPRWQRALGVAMLGISVTAGIAAATIGTGSTSVVLGRGTVHRGARISDSKGTDVVVAQNSFDPGGSSGWHSHPGVAVIAVQAGEITIYRADGADCKVHTYVAGESFVEKPGEVQNGINEGAVPTTVFATFFDVPVAGSPRIDMPDPGTCA